MPASTRKRLAVGSTNGFVSTVSHRSSVFFEPPDNPAIGIPTYLAGEPCF